MPAEFICVIVDYPILALKQTGSKIVMQTKLSRFLDGVIEASWLIVVAVVPLFFNVLSSRIFEPDKVAILKIFSLIILGAWTIRIIADRGIRWNNLNNGRTNWKSLLRTPFFLPVLVIAVVYIISTFFSIAPSSSLWGSYQRAQGLYTFLSYIVIFFAIAANLRRKSQINRLISLLIVTSLPIALYGVLQRYGLDPVPWEGKVQIRIASSMGNSIFVAAYIIMVIPLTIGRIIQKFKSISETTRFPIGDIVVGSAYIFILILQVSTLYLSQSRGPAMGWLAGSLLLIFLLIYRSGKKWLMVGAVTLMFLAVGFLTVFNIDGGPLEALRSSPTIGRFGRLIDPESNSALVRKYIWEGATELVAPHEPLEYPGGSLDKFNFLRPMIGYGPETMFVAFNRFYVPELGLVEKRNASPDRSHNETWDSIINGGVLGLSAYLLVFVSVFYYGYKWLGIIQKNSDRLKFIIFIFLGAVLGSILAIIWRGISYIGIGLPFGLVFGMLMYLLAKFFIDRIAGKSDHAKSDNFLLIAVILSALLSHFVEVNFGIAVVATQTHFWVYTGILLVVGYVFPIMYQDEQAIDIVDPEIIKQQASSTQKRDLVETRFLRIELFITGILVAVILSTLGYDFIGNPDGVDNTIRIFWNSITQLESGASTGILILLVTSWLIAGIILTLENSNLAGSSPRFSGSGSVRNIIIILGISLAISLFYWLWHANGLAEIVQNPASNIDELLNQVGLYENIFVNYVLALIFCGGAIGIGLGLLKIIRQTRDNFASSAGMVAAFIGTILLAVLINYSNLRMIRADIAYRIAGSLSRPGQWPIAVEVYKQVQELAPHEDHYYLSLAGVYFEQAKEIYEPTARNELLKLVERDLLKAQELNPLNTDHTANLARLYNLWSSYEEDPELRNHYAETSSNYYQIATNLSPKNTRLWGEWAILHISGLDMPEKAREMLEHAIEIDPNYDWTHGLLAEYYFRLSRTIEDSSRRRELLDQAAAEYELAIENVKYYEEQHLPGYILALAGIYTRLDQFSEAIELYELALKRGYTEEPWQVEEAIANLYLQTGDFKSALFYANSALSTAPADQRDKILILVESIMEEEQ